MKITDTTDFCWRFFPVHHSVGSFSMVLSFVCISSFIIFKKTVLFSLFCHHYLCLTWRFSFSSYHWLYLQVCVCVMCMGKQKNFLYPGRMRKSGIERESWGWMWEAVFWHKLRNVYQAKPFKCQALNFEVHFAPFPIRSSCKKKFVFFSSFRPNSTYEFSFFHT